MVSGLIGLSAVAFTTLFTQQIRSQNFLTFQMRRTDIQTAISGQFLIDPIQCSCLFKLASPLEFNKAASNVTLTTSTAPQSIGLYTFTTPGDCSTASIAVPFANQSAQDGVTLKSVSLTGITKVGASYSGTFKVSLKSTKEVLGPEIVSLEVPVAVKTLPGSTATKVKFESCGHTGSYPPAAATEYDSGWFPVSSLSDNSATLTHGLPSTPTEVQLYQCGAISAGDCTTRVVLAGARGYQDGSSFVNPVAITATSTEIEIGISGSGGKWVWGFWEPSGGWKCTGGAPGCRSAYYRLRAR